MQNGCLPPSVEKEQLVKIKAGGKSVDELTGKHFRVMCSAVFRMIYILMF